MNFHEIIFSEEKHHKYVRHLVFWLVWGLYFLVSMSFLPTQNGAPKHPQFSFQNFGEFLHLLLFLSIHILACYTFIYVLLPRYLLSRKYFLSFIGTMLLGFIMLQASRFIDVIVVPYFKKSDDSAVIPYYSSVFSGLISAVKIIAVAAAIRILKHWWLKQKEKERLGKERIEAELKFLKAQIQPDFLFSSLNKIYSYAVANSPKAPEMLLRLSEILSYMLYECGEEEVLLDKELKMLKNYMILEKIRSNNRIEMNVQVKGATSGVKIAPLLLQKFMENSFIQCSKALDEQPWINLEIQIENNIFFMKLMNGKSPDPSIIHNANMEVGNDLVIAKRQLDLMYPAKHVLKIIDEDEILMVFLQINLQPEFVESRMVNAEKISGQIHFS